jgi:hypothetical protein
VGATYVGTVVAIGAHPQDKNLIRVKLDQKGPSELDSVLLLPHEISAIDEPKPEKPPQAKESKESGTSGTSASDRKQTASKSASKPKAQAGETVMVPPLVRASSGVCASCPCSSRGT